MDAPTGIEEHSAEFRGSEPRAEVIAMSQEQWSAVDNYFAGLLVHADPVLDAALKANAEAGFPPHDVSPVQGKLLELLARIQGARSILEIGTLGGYSTIWLSRALPSDGRLVTLEVDSARAAVARENLRRAGLHERVDVRVGPALATLRTMIAEREGPFDFVFIDADKPSNPEYLEHALKLSRVGTVIVADNVVRDGAVIDAGSTDKNVLGIRRFSEQLAGDRRLAATAIQTVGTKGYDGFAIALVVAL
jgi:predicted O-methyltransferase YrrM